MPMETETTTDHEEIRDWVERRGGRPATARASGGDGAGVLSIVFSGVAGAARPGGVDVISWDEWFERFDEAGLAFSYEKQRDDGSDGVSCRIIRR